MKFFDDEKRYRAIKSSFSGDFELYYLEMKTAFYRGGSCTAQGALPFTIFEAK